MSKASVNQTYEFAPLHELPSQEAVDQFQGKSISYTEDRVCSGCENGGSTTVLSDQLSAEKIVNFYVASLKLANEEIMENWGPSEEAEARLDISQGRNNRFGNWLKGNALMRNTCRDQADYTGGIVHNIAICLLRGDQTQFTLTAGAKGSFSDTDWNLEFFQAEEDETPLGIEFLTELH